MNLVVFGANGRSGILIVRQALDEGHNVTAYVRDKQKIHFLHERLKVLEGDVLNYCKVESAIDGQEAVILALGNNKGSYDNYLTIATKNIIRVMEDKKVKRLICISATGVLGNDGGFVFDNILNPLFFKKIYAEKKRQLQLMLRSNLDWIIVRPPQLTNLHKKGNYHITYDKPHRYKISREDLTDFILKLLTNNEYVRKMPIISY